MVWAIGFSGEYNEFLPHGDFVGHDEALFQANEPVDGDGFPYATFRQYKHDVIRKFHEELGVRSNNGPPLRQIEPHEWPTEFLSLRSHKRSAALLVFSNHMFAVTKPLRDLIEQLEPGVHQFRPFRMLLPQGLEHPIQHYLMAIGNWLDSVREDASDPKFIRFFSNGQGAIGWDRKAKRVPVAVSTSLTANAHIWAERRLLVPSLLISDRLKLETEEAALRLPPMYRLTSVA